MLTRQTDDLTRSLRRLGRHTRTIVLFLASVALFVLAIALMKEGAADLAPIVRDRFGVRGVAASLGFGWLFAYAVMSGSPVAAAALTFFDAQAIDRMEAFAMITGSRLGSGLVILVIGLLYVVRGRDRGTSLSMPLLTYVITGTTYVVAFALGVWLLATGVLDGLQPDRLAAVTSFLDTAVQPLIDLLLAFVPRWSLFAIGLVLIVASFSLFDRSLPETTVKSSPVGQVAALVYRPWVMLLLGGAITLLSMSVSLSISILVPLSDRGLIRRENVIPYIMGANITTFVDTLIAAVLLGNREAFTVVLTEMIAVGIVSAVILMFFYGAYTRLVLGLVGWATKGDRQLAVFVLVMVAIPFLLLVV